MATVNKSEWLIVIPDFPGAAERRSSLLPQHIERIKKDPEGFLVFGGASLAEPLNDERPPQFTGSAMLVTASSKDDIMNRLKDDPYVTGKVWDLDKAQILPFFRPNRKPLA